MIRQIVTVGPLAAAVANYFVTSVTPTSGQVLTLAHTGAPSGVPQRIQAAYGNEASARTLTLTGKNYAGLTITEVLAIPSGSSGTATSLQDFATLTRAQAGGGAWTAAMTLGTCNIASSPWQKITEHVTPVNLSINCVINGTVNYTIETTNDDLDPPACMSTNGAPFGPAGPIPPICTPFPNAVADGVAINQVAPITLPANAWRLTLNSGAGSVTATAIQSGIIQGH